MQFLKFWNGFFLFFTLLFSTAVAQDYLINLKFSGKLSGEDYKDSGEISLDALLPLFENKLEAGLFAGDITATLKGNPTIDNAFIQKTFAGLSIYYNWTIKESRFIPFVGLKGAYLFKFLADISKGNYYSTTPYSPGYYDHYTDNDFMMIFSFGTKIDLFDTDEENGKFIFGFDYQIRKFDLKYVELYETDNSDYLSIKYHTNKMRLNAIRWSIGLQLNL